MEAAIRNAANNARNTNTGELKFQLLPLVPSVSP
jgi:hypothetical protein